jgi:DNA-binding XRE family transcriptional regulator
LTQLREFRIAKVLTQWELARLAKINKATVQSLESGEHLANSQTAHKLSPSKPRQEETRQIDLAQQAQFDEMWGIILSRGGEEAGG